MSKINERDKENWGIQVETVPLVTLDDLKDRTKYQDPHLECDLVMKGGITSGVIYPRAVCRLATRYTFKQVGGASAGAIAAALAAAAEFGRRRPCPPGGEPDEVGFVGLNRIPAIMGENLAGLFQPSPATTPAYRVLTAWIEPGWGAGRKFAATLFRIIISAPAVFVLALLTGLLPGLAVAGTVLNGPGWGEWWHVTRVCIIWLPGALVFAFSVCAIRLALKTMTGMGDNGFGLCNGHDPLGPRAGQPALTDWLATTLDALAALETGHGPLTFGDLWGSEAVANYKKWRELDKAHTATPADWRTFRPTIDLKVMTTNLTYGRPYQFPFSTDEFFFCPLCISDYFPPDIVTHMFNKTTPVSGLNDDPPISMSCPVHDTETVRFLPPAHELPVVVAARLSLSFPGLISAVPLYAVDRSRLAENRRLIRIWFSDGGITSNFPMHFFDSMWPSRPTFGIDLQPYPEDYPQERVYRPRSVSQGKQPRIHSMTSVPQFVSALLDAMQNWSDTMQVTMPGFRNRITEVRTNKTEGGMNLKMKACTIEHLARRGFEAAGQFDDFNMDLHRWIRYRVAMNALDDSLDTLHAKYTGETGDPRYDELIPALGGRTKHYRFPSDDALQRDIDATHQLMDTAGQWAAAQYPATAEGVPRPRPQLRQMPPR